MTAPVDLHTIVAMLADRIPALVAELLPGAARDGRDWRMGSPAGEPGRSMIVWGGGARQGEWHDFAGAEGGDALHLAAAVLFGGDLKKAVPWAKAWLGLDNEDPARFATARRQAEKRSREGAEEEETRRASARAIYLAGAPELGGTPVWAYLAGRGIDLGALPRPVRALRYHRELWNGETRRHWPALVAAISLPQAPGTGSASLATAPGSDGPAGTHRARAPAEAGGGVVAVHRTWLQILPDGSVRKAPLQNPKMSLGRFAGGCISLWRGASGKPLARALAGETVVISEGIEDGLTAALARPEHRVLVAVSLANMGAMVLPEAIATVIVLAQNDAPGSDAERALVRAIRHFHEMGKAVRIARPPAGVKDVNEMAQAEMRVRAGGQ